VVRRRQLKKSSLSEAMTKNGSQIFSRKNRVHPSVAAPGDTNPRDATATEHIISHMGMGFAGQITQPTA